MIIELTATATPEEARRVAERAAAHSDVTAWPLALDGRRLVVVSGDEALVPELDHPAIAGRHSTHPRGYWLADRANGLAPSEVHVGRGAVGGGRLWCAAGPCALESFDDALRTAQVVRHQGADAFRIGVFKPRTTPYNFQGKGRRGLAMLTELADASGLPVVTEVLDPRDVEPVARVADCLQVGTRNMTNQALLKELGQVSRPVLLKRGFRAPVLEWLRAAEFIMAHGNAQVVLCARGVASFDDSLRFMPDLGAVLAVRERTNLPVVFDPSHSAGRRAAVGRIALAAAAVGVDGLLVEAHIDPARCYEPGDGPQAYPPERLGGLLRACSLVRESAVDLGE